MAKGIPVCAGGVNQVRDRCCRIEGCSLESLEPLKFPLCGHHLAQITADIGKVVWSGSWRGRTDLLEDELNEPRRARQGDPKAIRGMVYYVAINDLVKIGFSTNIRSRLASFRILCANPQLLAAEPGTMQGERLRHQQFAADRAHGELFRRSDELMAHIDYIAGKYGTGG